MTDSPSLAEPGANLPLETYQVVGRILGPAVFVLMLAFDSWQDAMNRTAWHVAAVGL